MMGELFSIATQYVPVSLRDVDGKLRVVVPCELFTDTVWIRFSGTESESRSQATVVFSKRLLWNATTRESGEGPWNTV